MACWVCGPMFEAATLSCWLYAPIAKLPIMSCSDCAPTSDAPTVTYSIYASTTKSLAVTCSVCAPIAEPATIVSCWGVGTSCCTRGNAVASAGWRGGTGSAALSFCLPMPYQGVTTGVWKWIGSFVRVWVDVPWSECIIRINSLCWWSLTLSLSFLAKLLW